MRLPREDMKTTEPIATRVDMAAASRIARRVDLAEIKLTHVSADRSEGPSGGELRPSLSHEHRSLPCDSGKIVLLSTYSLTVSTAELSVMSVEASYQLTYKLLRDDPVEENDLVHFASANGAYHSWPFVRELFFGLTSKMGFPPFTLPVMSFTPRQKSGEKSES
jgi:hypothetical protein